MAVVVVFDVPGMTSAQYDAVVKDLEGVGLAAPDGRQYHVAAARDGGWLVVDVWESTERLNAFSGPLMGFLRKNGVPQIQPQVHGTHNIIKG